MNPIFQIILAETIGTFILCTAILSTGEAIPIGLALAAAIFVASFASGGHFNPAVSFMMVLKGTISLDKAPLYLAGQLMGAFLAVVWYHKIPQKLAVHR